jgi:type II secretion system protein H
VKTRGFTLVETLVVLVIMSLLATTVIMTWPEKGALRDDARALAARATLAAQESILSGTATGLDVTAHGYAFYELKDGRWREMDGDRAFRRQTWREGVVPVLSREGMTEKTRSNATAAEGPGVVFDPTGLGTAFTLILAEKDARYVVAGDNRGLVMVLPSHD